MICGRFCLTFAFVGAEAGEREQRRAQRTRRTDTLFAAITHESCGTTVADCACGTLSLGIETLTLLGGKLYRSNFRFNYPRTRPTFPLRIHSARSERPASAVATPLSYMFINVVKCIFRFKCNRHFDSTSPRNLEMTAPITDKYLFISNMQVVKITSKNLLTT